MFRSVGFKMGFLVYSSVLQLHEIDCHRRYFHTKWHNAYIFYNGCFVEGVLHLTSNYTVKIDSQYLLRWWKTMCMNGKSWKRNCHGEYSRINPFETMRLERNKNIGFL